MGYNAGRLAAELRRQNGDPPIRLRAAYMIGCNAVKEKARGQKGARMYLGESTWVRSTGAHQAHVTPGHVTRACADRRVPQMLRVRSGRGRPTKFKQRLYIL